MKINLKTVFLIVVLVAVAIGLLVSHCALKRRADAYRKDGRAQVERVPTTDTVRVARIKPIRHIAPVVVPPVVAVARIPDTLLRQRLEKSTIIVSLEKRKPKRRGFFRKRQGVDSLYIQAVTPKGIVTESRYPWKWVEHGNFTVDSAGRLHIDPALSEKEQAKAARREKWKGVWRTAKTTAVAVGVAVLGFFLITR